MGEPLSPDRVFDFPRDEPHPAYNFFAPGPLPGYAGLMVDEIAEQMVDPIVEEVVELMVEAEKHMVLPVIYLEGDLIVLFGEDDDFEDDDFKGEEEAWEVNKEWMMAPVTPPSVSFMPPPSVYEVRACEEGDLGDGVLDGSLAADRFEQNCQPVSIRLSWVNLTGNNIAERHTDPAAADYDDRDEKPWVEAKMVIPEVGSEKWRRLLLHSMSVAFDVLTDDREEDFFLRNGM
ncbi:hypothetical protein Tco_1119809 [Tanacetum coccineum]